MDPALVLYESSGPQDRIDASQADLVEIIHTSGGYIGFQKSLGHRDFYPNGGVWPQPGCVVDYAGTNSCEGKIVTYVNQYHFSFLSKVTPLSFSQYS